MKINKILFGLSSLLFAFQLISFGQGKTITKDEYDSMRKTAQEKTDQKIRRETTSETRYSGEQPTKVTIVQEYLPPDKSKWLVIESIGNMFKKTELIYIGDTEYRKENQTGWKTRNLKGDGGGGGDSGRSVGFTAREMKKNESYSVEEQKLDGKVYKVLTSKVVNETYPSFSENKMWIDKDGLIYKQEYKNSLYKIENVIDESLTNYDYAVKNIKIEAPEK